MAAKWVRKTVRLTEMEARLLAERAAESGLPENQYIRFQIRQRPSDYLAVQKLLKELINEINRIGNNINQIVHGNHMDFYTEADKEQLSAYMRRLNLSMREVIEKIGNQ